MDIMIHTLRTFFAGSTSVSRIRKLLKDLRARRAQRLAFNRAYGELQLLSKRELDEFGLHRSDLFEMARASVYRV
jgi:uncharacterized protein YjiS (DUF1127 family)